MPVNKFLLSVFSAMVFFLCVTCGLVCAEDAATATNTTLNNLQTAYNAEMNANAMYLAFAQQAKLEDYDSVASLFRAIAFAEQVHAERYAALIRRLGGTPKAVIETPVVKSTQENLDASLAAERKEDEEMYANFMQQAEEDGVEDAVTAFKDIEAAEASHTARYVKVLDNFQDLKGLQKDFFVCPVCGEVLDVLAVAKCPVCGTSRMQFKKK